MCKLLASCLASSWTQQWNSCQLPWTPGQSYKSWMVGTYAMVMCLGGFSSAYAMCPYVVIYSVNNSLLYK